MGALAAFDDDVGGEARQGRVGPGLVGLAQGELGLRQAGAAAHAAHLVSQMGVARFALAGADGRLAKKMLWPALVPVPARTQYAAWWSRAKWAATVPLPKSPQKASTTMMALMGDLLGVVCG